MPIWKCSMKFLNIFDRKGKRTLESVCVCVCLHDLCVHISVLPYFTIVSRLHDLLAVHSEEMKCVCVRVFLCPEAPESHVSIKCVANFQKKKKKNLWNAYLWIGLELTSWQSSKKKKKKKGKSKEAHAGIFQVFINFSFLLLFSIKMAAVLFSRWDVARPLFPPRLIK